MRKIARTTKGDIEYLIEHIRDCDRREIEACGATVEIAVKNSVASSDLVRSGFLDGKLCIIYGVSGNNFNDEGVIWALGTTHCQNAKLAMVDVPKRMIPHLLRRYSKLSNYCYSKNKSTIKWLKMMGFSIGEPLPYGPKGELFCKLEIER